MYRISAETYSIALHCFLFFSENLACIFLRGVAAILKDASDVIFHNTAQLVEALRYKPESCGFVSRWGHWDFSLTESFRPHYGLGVD